MAHFSKISEENIVLQVLTLNNSDMLNADGIEDESIGQIYLETHNNWPRQLWVQTSYNTKNNKYYNIDGTEHSDQTKAFRGNYAGIGYQWDLNNQIFWPKKPFTSWLKNIQTANWKSPIGDSPEFTDEQLTQINAKTHAWLYVWNEENQTWDLQNNI